MRSDIVDLALNVATECGIDQEQAKKGLGTLFTAVRMAINADEHQILKQAFPQVDEWLGHGMMGGGRTGEMLALIGPEALENNLRRAGFEDTDIPTIGSIVGQALNASVPEIATKVGARLPLIKS